ncbi:MAG: hypothetical protein ACUVSX_01390 [Aggregatilineales bacterium]
MRHFVTLDTMNYDADSGILRLGSSQEMGTAPQIAMRREGAYMAIAASYGPLEIALRPQHEELARLLGRLQPVKGLQTTRQVGTAQAYLAIGLHIDGTLVMRPTIVADAAGHFSLNLVLTPPVREQFFAWLPVEREAEA